MRDADELGFFIDRAQHSLFRLEALDHYDVGSDGGDFRRYMDGEDGPDPERKAAWHRVLRADLDRGVTTRRVHLVRSPLSDYLRYEFEWGYAHNLGFEDIRILDAAERPVPAILDGVPDFWLVDETAAAVMNYDAGGRFLGWDEGAPDWIARYARARDAAWEAAEPFGAWWDDHRQFWRGSRRAA